MAKPRTPKVAVRTVPEAKAPIGPGVPDPVVPEPRELPNVIPLERLEITPRGIPDITRVSVNQRQITPPTGVAPIPERQVPEQVVVSPSQERVRDSGIKVEGITSRSVPETISSGSILNREIPEQVIQSPIARRDTQDQTRLGPVAQRGIQQETGIGELSPTREIPPGPGRTRPLRISEL